MPRLPGFDDFDQVQSNFHRIRPASSGGIRETYYRAGYQEASRTLAPVLSWAKDRGYLEEDYADEDYPIGEPHWVAMIDALRAFAGVPRVERATPAPEPPEVPPVVPERQRLDSLSIALQEMEKNARERAKTHPPDCRCLRCQMNRETPLKLEDPRDHERNETHPDYCLCGKPVAHCPGIPKGRCIGRTRESGR